MDSLTAGTFVGAGSFRCEHCGYTLTLVGSDVLTACPGCGGQRLRARLAVQHRARSRRRGGTERRREGTLLQPPRPGPRRAAGQRRREQIEQPGEYLCYEDGGELRTVALTREWTRIGRSLAADVRFDDPTVSRRHALIVRQPDGVRLLDDRSLNGVFVNGARVDGKALQDGDEIIVGRYRLAFLSVPPDADRRGGADRLQQSLARRSAEAPGPRAAPRPGARRRVVSRRWLTRSLCSRRREAPARRPTVRTLTDVLRRSGVRTLAVDLDPQGNLSDYFDLPTDVEPTIADVLSGTLARRRGDPRGHHPGQPEPRRGRADARRQDGPRADAAGGRWRRPASDYEVILIDCPPSLGPADGQRARRRRPRADHRRGAVLRAAGRRAGDGGGRAGARQPQPASCRCSACCSTSPTCAPSTRARRSPRCRSASASRSSTRSSAPRSPTPSRPSARARSSTTAPTSAPTTSRWPPSCSSACRALDGAERARWRELAQSSPT